MNDENIQQSELSKQEEKILAFWEENHIFEKSVSTPAGSSPKGSFTFYDGPPFATGVPHIGHILAGTIKDIIPRYQTMKGNTVRRVWGWDCHGLPLENEVEKKFDLKNKKDIEEFGIAHFNEEARNLVLTYEHEWQNIIPRMGRFVDMQHAYKTMDSTYTESIWWSFKTLYDKSLIYEGYKIMQVCPRCTTTLAQSEVAQGYKDVTDISVTAKFELIDEPGTYVLAWTTTPWTLPGNTALAINPCESYIKVQSDNEHFIVAKNLVEKVFAGKEYELIEEIKTEALIGKKYAPVFDYYVDTDFPNKDNAWKIVGGEFVTIESGTGIVHIAPAFGADDYELAKAENLPIIHHVKMDGTFVPEVTDFKGMLVKKAGDTQSADIEIIKKLAHTGKLFSKEKLIHSYPHCWRCDTPLLNYATTSWFMDIGAIKGKLISENQKIGWTPEHVRDGRFGKWLEGARDWALSRTRYWGAPLPVWKCEECKRVEVIGSLEELRTKETAHNTYAVMRHGEAASNIGDFADSGSNTTNHLTELGQKEIRESAEKIKTEGFDLIITSPVLRARETAEITAEVLGGVPIEVDERLREFEFGIYDGQEFPDFWNIMRKAHYDFDLQVEGGESYRDVQKRVAQVLFDCEQKYAHNKILFVTHGGILWQLIAISKNLSDEQTRQYRKEMKAKNGVRYFIPNGYVETLDFKPFPHRDGLLDFHRPYIDEVMYTCGEKCSGEMKRIPDVFDCWYESGSMPFAALHYPFENRDVFDKNFPAQFIAEGLDQTRGWFYSLINLGVGLFDKAPYEHVIVNGLTLAADGQKMSKSKKNYTDPSILVKKYSADALRYALVSGPLVRGENIAFPDSLIDEVHKKLCQRLQNVYSFYDMTKEEGIVPHNESQHPLDHWIRARLNETQRAVTVNLDTFSLDGAARPLEDFIDDLSTWYLRRSRNRIKSDDQKTRNNALGTLGFVLLEFSKTLAPFMPFLSETIYLGITEGKAKESVHLEEWSNEMHIDEEALMEMKNLRDLVSSGLEARNKVGIKVRQPLASLTVPSLGGLSEGLLQEALDELNIKNIYENSSLEEVVLDTTLTKELIEEGDMRELIRAIKDLRKEKGLQAGELVTLFCSQTLPESIVEKIKTESSISSLVVETGIPEGKKVQLSTGELVIKLAD